MDLRADYLIIGSGIAGLRAAPELSTAGEVLILTKAEPDEGNTGHAQGGIAVAVGAGDSPELHALDTLAAGIETRARLERELDVAIDRAGGPDAVLACGQVAIDQSDVPRMALAWKLGLPLGDIGRRPGDGPGVLFARLGGPQDRGLSGGRPDVVPVARSAEWVVYALACPTIVTG